MALPVDPPAAPGDLKSELAGYTTLDACVKARAATLDPLLSDTLGALGYETFLRDSCRLLEAAKREDAAACAPIGASPLRARCLQWVAIARAEPDACPLEGRPEEGRDPFCLAVAARDAHACLAVPTDRRDLCLAVVKGDAHLCATSLHPEPCAREATRMIALTAANEAKTKPKTAPPATVRVVLQRADGADGADAGADARPSSGTGALLHSAERGVVTVRDRTSQSVTFGQGDDLGTTGYTPPAQGGVNLSVKARVQAAETTIEQLELSVPGAGILVVPGVAWDGTVQVVGDTTTRGAPCHLLIKGTIGVAPQTYRLDLDVQTYIRDVVDGVLPALSPSHRHEERER